MRNAADRASTAHRKRNTTAPRASNITPSCRSSRGPWLARKRPDGAPKALRGPGVFLVTGRAVVRKRRAALSEDRPGAYDDGTVRRCVPILVLVLGALFGCEQRFSSDALSPENF